MTNAQTANQLRTPSRSRSRKTLPPTPIFSPDPGPDLAIHAKRLTASGKKCIPFIPTFPNSPYPCPRNTPSTLAFLAVCRSTSLSPTNRCLPLDARSLCNVICNALGSGFRNPSSPLTTARIHLPQPNSSTNVRAALPSLLVHKPSLHPRCTNLLSPSSTPGNDLVPPFGFFRYSSRYSLVKFRASSSSAGYPVNIHALSIKVLGPLPIRSWVSSSETAFRLCRFSTLPNAREISPNESANVPSRSKTA